MSDLSFDEACAQVTGPGQIFEIGEADVRGHTQRVFVNAPGSLRDLFATLGLRGDETFLVYEDERLSFGEVSQLIGATGALLVDRYGVQPGDRVAIAMRNYPEWIIAFAAITSIGAISVSFNSWWVEDEVTYALEDSTPKVAFVDEPRMQTALAGAAKTGTQLVVVREDGPLPDGVDRWDDVLDREAPLPEVAIDTDQDATILYTSGTTGRPKGAVSTHRAVVSAVMAFGCRSTVDGMRGSRADEGMADPNRPRASFLLAVPLFHVTGCVAVMLSCVLGGLKLVIMHKWDAKRALELIQGEKIAAFVGVPTQSWDLVHHPDRDQYDTSSLRRITGGGAPAPPALVEQVSSSFKSGDPGLGYGMTETNAYGAQIAGADYLAHPTSTGRVVPIVQIQIRGSDGEPVPADRTGDIWFTGPNLFRGYWGKDEATAEVLVDGWLDTGDIGRLDEEGFLYIEDRAKDMILRGGENVYGAEVEAAIYEHPAVYEAAVFGIPHDRLGEEVAAAIYPKPGQDLNPAELVEFLKEHLAGFKIPTHVIVTEEPLPRNAAGKFLKRELRDLVD
jgi:long-chain acyl-CoA synthetase